MLNFPLVLMNRLNKTKSAVFLYWRLSLFLRDPFFPDYLEVTTAVLCRVELVKLLLVYRYSVDIFTYSGPSGILGSDGKQNTA